MRCGNLGYLVTYEEKQMRKAAPISARTPAEARKKFRAAYGNEVIIISVVRER